LSGGPLSLHSVNHAPKKHQQNFGVQQPLDTFVSSSTPRHRRSQSGSGRGVVVCVTVVEEIVVVDVEVVDVEVDVDAEVEVVDVDIEAVDVDVEGVDVDVVVVEVVVVVVVVVVVGLQPGTFSLQSQAPVVSTKMSGSIHSWIQPHPSQHVQNVGSQSPSGKYPS